MRLRILHVEDDRNDRELIAEMLRAESIDCDIEAVASRSAFEHGLDPPPDLILSDFSMPEFDGTTAQQIALARCPDVPFVFVSGSIGEERAVESLKRGATDYVLKHRLEKLPSTVRRAISEADNRRRRAAAEAALRELNAQLEARVEERTKELVTANAALARARAEADRANQAKSEFLSGMSHDLRTPLNAIMGFAELLQLDPLSADQAESVLHILRGGRHLLNLINEVLDIARIEAGHLTLSPEPVRVSHIIDEAAALVQPLAAQRGLSLHVDATPALIAVADQQRLNQVLLNILSNAVKYNRRGGSVSIQGRQDDGTVRIDVSDTGAGIPPDKLARLFTPFERLGAESSGIEGTGLGLTLAKKLTEAMNGTLTVDSAVDVGTTFHVTLPRAVDPPVDDSHAEERHATRTVSGSVLYIEDNASNVQLMRRILQRQPGASLHHAPDGRSGVAMIAAVRPDLVILDLHLSDMHGEDVLRQLQSDPATRSIPVAVLSADASSATQRRLLAAGAFRYLTKPFAIADILRLVDDVLGRTR